MLFVVYCQPFIVYSFFFAHPTLNLLGKGSGNKLFYIIRIFLNVIFDLMDIVTYVAVNGHSLTPRSRDYSVNALCCASIRDKVATILKSDTWRQFATKPILLPHGYILAFY